MFLIKQHTSGGTAPHSKTSALDGGEWSASYPQGKEPVSTWWGRQSLPLLGVESRSSTP